jgi:hypothetical protein
MSNHEITCNTDLPQPVRTRDDFTYKFMYQDGKGFWHGVRWDGKTVSFFALQETDERQACKELCKKGESEATHSSSR